MALGVLPVCGPEPGRWPVCASAHAYAHTSTRTHAHTPAECLPPGRPLLPVGLAPAAQSAPEPKTAAELIAQRWQAVEGLDVTIKGAQTAAPVIWLTGDTEAHADEIKQAGGKWSAKRSAFYFRVA